MENNDTKNFEKDYSEDGFWAKVKEYAITVGCEGIRSALILYYVLDNPNLPTKTKAIIYGALGYFISPLDVIPDILPGGFVDDIGILAAALALAATYIDAEVKAKADEKLADWFGEGAC